MPDLRTSIQDVDSDVNVAMGNASIGVPTVNEPAMRPKVEIGSIGKAVQDRISTPLANTGLEQIARRVFPKRGIDPSDYERIKGLESFASRSGRRPLRDVVEASLPLTPAPRLLDPTRARFESIVGSIDSRERVFDTDHYPFSAIAALEIMAKDGTIWCGTAWFVSPRTLITAGHCVYIRGAQQSSANGWVQSIRVIPGRNGISSGNEPFGSVQSTVFRSVAGWVNNGSMDADYGAIILPEDHPLGAEVGTFGIGAFNDEDLARFMVNVAGYPADKVNAEEQTLWFDAQKVRKTTERQIFYDVDTYGGQSGAPVFIIDDNRRIAVAIHTYGTSNTVASNSATRITNQVLARIESWKV